MRTSVSTLAVALMLAAAPAALAQTGSTRQSMGQSMGQGQSPAAGLDPQVEQDVRERMGPQQREVELVQTTVLNRFGGLGFHRIVDIRKRDASYVAMVENVAGETVAVEIDAATGRIVSEGPVSPEDVAGSIGGTGMMGPGSGASGMPVPGASGTPGASGSGMMTPAMPLGTTGSTGSTIQGTGQGMGVMQGEPPVGAAGMSPGSSGMTRPPGTTGVMDRALPSRDPAMQPVQPPAADVMQ
jgi:hypothetical protein